MSLKDTIRGAREEALANAAAIESKTEDGAETSTETAARPASSAGFTRKSAAKGKPARQAAAGVRVVTSTGKTKNKSQMSKEERKAEQKRDRELEDQRYTLSQAMLKENEEYNRLHKIWLRFLIAGIVLMVIALSLYGLISQQGETTPIWLATAAMISMVLAYVVIIAGMVFDWRKVKPIREETDKRVSSMSEKRVRMALAKRVDSGSK